MSSDSESDSNELSLEQLRELALSSLTREEDSSSSAQFSKSTNDNSNNNNTNNNEIASDSSSTSNTKESEESKTRDFDANMMEEAENNENVPQSPQSSSSSSTQNHEEQRDTELEKTEKPDEKVGVDNATPVNAQSSAGNEGKVGKEDINFELAKENHAQTSCQQGNQQDEKNNELKENNESPIKDDNNSTEEETSVTSPKDNNISTSRVDQIISSDKNEGKDEDEGEDMDLGDDDDITRTLQTNSTETTTNSVTTSPADVTETSTKTDSSITKFDDLSSLSSSESSDSKTSSRETRSTNHSRTNISSRSAKNYNDSGDEFDALLRRHTARQQKKDNDQHPGSGSYSSSSASPISTAPPHKKKKRRSWRRGGRASRGRRGRGNRRFSDNRNRRQSSTGQPSSYDRQRMTPTGVSNTDAVDMHTTGTEASTPIKHRASSQHKPTQPPPPPPRTPSQTPPPAPSPQTSRSNSPPVQHQPHHLSTQSKPPPPPPSSQMQQPNRRHNQEQEQQQYHHHFGHRRLQDQPTPPPPPSPPPSPPIPHAAPSRDARQQYMTSQGDPNLQPSHWQTRPQHTSSQLQLHQLHQYQYQPQSQPQTTHYPQPQQSVRVNQYNQQLHVQQQQQQQQQHSALSYRQYQFPSADTSPDLHSRNTTVSPNMGLPHKHTAVHQQHRQYYYAEGQQQRHWQPQQHYGQYQQPPQYAEQQPQGFNSHQSGRQQQTQVYSNVHPTQYQANTSRSSVPPPPPSYGSYSTHSENPPWKQTAVGNHHTQNQDQSHLQQQQQEQYRVQQSQQPQPPSQRQAHSKRPQEPMNHKRVVLSFDSSEESDTESSTDPHASSSPKNLSQSRKTSPENNEELNILKKKLAEMEREKKMIMQSRKGQTSDSSRITGKRNTPDTSNSSLLQHNSDRPRKRKRIAPENIQSEIESARTMLNSKEDKLRSAQSRLQQAERKVYQNNEQLRQVRGQKKEISSQMRKLEQQLSVLRSVFAECEADEEDCQAQIEAAERQRDSSQRMADSLENDVDSLNLRVYEMNLHLRLLEGKKHNWGANQSEDNNKDVDMDYNYADESSRNSNENFRNEAPLQYQSRGAALSSESSSSESEDLEALRQQAMASVKQAAEQNNSRNKSKSDQVNANNTVTTPQKRPKIQLQTKPKRASARYKYSKTKPTHKSKYASNQKYPHTQTQSNTFKHPKPSSPAIRHHTSSHNTVSFSGTSQQRKPRSLNTIHKTLVNTPKEPAEQENKRLMDAFEKALSSTEDGSCAEGLFMMNTAGGCVQFACLNDSYIKHTLAASLGYITESSSSLSSTLPTDDAFLTYTESSMTEESPKDSRSLCKKHIDDDYQSPLFCLRSYRLSSAFTKEWKRSPASISFANKINPFTLFCRFELHGQCNDDECRWQHKRNYIMSDQEIIDDLLSYLPDSSPRPQRLIQQTLEDLKSKERSTALLSLIEHVRSVATNSFKHKNSDELDGDEEDSEYPTLCADILRRSSFQQPVSSIIHKISDSNKHTENIENLVQPGFIDHTSVSLSSASSSSSTDSRYFDENTTNDSKQYEVALLHSPHDLWKWVKYGLEVMTKQKGGSVGMPTDVTSSHLKHGLSILARGLEHNPNAECLWLVYMELFFMYPDIADAEERRKLFRHAVKFLPGSFLLWHAFLHSEIDLGSKCSCIDDALDSFSASNLDDNDKSRFMGAMMLEKASLLSSAGRTQDAIKYLENIFHSLESEETVVIIDDNEGEGGPKKHHMAEFLKPLHMANLWIVRIALSVLGRFPFATHGRRSSFLKEMDTPLGIQYSRANMEHVRDAYVECKNLYEKAMKTVEGPSDARLPIIFNYVHLELYLNNYDNARDICQRCIQQQPYCLDLWVLYAEFEDPENSRTIYNRAMEYFPNVAVLLYHYALFLYRNDEREKAVDTLCIHIVRHAKDNINNKNAKDRKQARALYRIALGLPTDKDESTDVEASEAARHDVYLWLCYIMLETIENNFDTCEQCLQRAFQEFNRYDADRCMLWWEYLVFLKVCRRKDSSLLGRAVNNCLTDARVFLKNHPHPDSPDVHPVLELLRRFQDYPFVNHLAKVYISFDYRFHNAILKNIYLSTLTPRTASLSIENYCLLFPDNYLFHLGWIDHEILVMKRVARAIRIAKSLYRKFPTFFPVWDKLLALMRTQGDQEQIRALFNAAKPHFRYIALFWERYLDFERKHKKNSVELLQIKNQINESGVHVTQ